MLCRGIVLEKIFVTKTFLPPIKEYNKYLKCIYKNNQLTNQGPLLQELEKKLIAYFGIKYLHYVANGTLALQIAFNAIGIEHGEIITTPFSYVATVSSVLWEKYTPVFVDIEEENFTIDTDKIEKAITEKTKAILAVHVFGYACNVERIEAIAKKHKLKVVYDGAHAFGVKYKGKSLLSYGDISTCSFHATKLFHTVEGGCCITSDKKINDKLELIKRFGHNYDKHYMLGINAKNSEFHAAMGLANFPYIKKNINERKKLSKIYDFYLYNVLKRPRNNSFLQYNYSYYPVLFANERQLLETFSNLNKENIYPRRYFYPSLNTLSYLQIRQSCPVSENISKKIACLPLYSCLKEDSVIKICQIIKRTVC